MPERVDFLTVAKDVVQKVSRADPNTIYGQAIETAILCQIKGWDPLMLQAGIFNTITAIPELVEAAKIEHRRYGVDVPVTEELMQNNLLVEFQYASRLMRLPREELIALKRYSHQLKEEGHNLENREGLLHKMIEEKLADPFLSGRGKRT